MTICVGVCTSEGIVLAADSRSTYSNPRNWPRTASDSVQKVFQISEKVACATFGWGMLSNRTIHSIVEGLKHDIDDSQCDVDAARTVLTKAFQSEYDRHVAAGFDKPVAEGHVAFGFLIAGYKKDGVGHLGSLLFPGGHWNPMYTTLTSGAAWCGQTDVISRLIRGFDPRIDVSQMPTDVREALMKSEYVIHYMRMSIQDAIDFAIFLARTTAEMQRFSDGIRAQTHPGSFIGVGGPIDVCVVRPAGFAWIQKKELHGEAPSWMDTLGEETLG